MLQQKFAVIGIGRFGAVIARTLAKKGSEVLAIDRNENIIEDIVDEVASAIALDATDKKALIAQNIHEFDAVIVSIGDNFEQRLLCAALLQDLGVKRIIARSGGKNQSLILQKIGIKEILTPEDEVGINISERLLNPSIISYLELPDDYKIAEIVPPPDTVGRNIKDIDFINRYHINVFTIKEETSPPSAEEEKREYHIIGMPKADTVIRKNHYLVMFGKSSDIEKFIEINQ